MLERALADRWAGRPNAGAFAKDATSSAARMSAVLFGSLAPKTDPCVRPVAKRLVRGASAAANVRRGHALHGAPRSGADLEVAGHSKRAVLRRSAPTERRAKHCAAPRELDRCIVKVRPAVFAGALEPAGIAASRSSAERARASPSATTPPGGRARPADLRLRRMRGLDSATRTHRPRCRGRARALTMRRAPCRARHSSRSCRSPSRSGACRRAPPSYGRATWRRAWSGRRRDREGSSC